MPAVFAIFHIVANALETLQCFIAFHNNVSVMSKKLLFAIVRLDKAKAAVIAKPFNYPCIRHDFSISILRLSSPLSFTSLVKGAATLNS